MSSNAKPPIHPVARAVLDIGPLIVFFATFEFGNIFIATGVFMAAVFAALGVGYWLERRLSPMPVVTAILVLIFGGLTLWLKNDTFIKMKPTALYAFFGCVLLGGLAFDRLFIKYVFGHAFDLSEEGWRKLTWRWGIFAFVLAGLNEFVWRDFSTQVWVNFKVFGIFPLFFLFALAQTPLIQRYDASPKSE